MFCSRFIHVYGSHIYVLHESSGLITQLAALPE